MNEPNDAKISTKKRNSMKKSEFCGFFRASDILA